MENTQESHEANANYEFPTEKTYEFMKSILKLPKGKSSSGVLPNRKLFLQNSFAISIVDGKEIIIHRKSNKPLVVCEKANEIIEKFHQESHSGVNPTYLKMKENYHHIPQRVVCECIAKCEVCSRRKTGKLPPTGKPIVVNGIMERVQIDLINLSHSADREFKYILQVFYYILLIL